MLHAFDLAVMSIVNAFAGRSPVFDRFVGLVHATTTLKGGIIVAVLCWLWAEASRTPAAAALRDPRAADPRAAVVRMFLAIIAAILIGRLAQVVLPERRRPIVSGDLGVVFGAGASTENWDRWSSLPSDHAVYLMAAATAFGFRSRGFGLAFALFMIVTQLLPRIYFGEHYPSDIVAGCLIGVAIGWGVMRAPGLAGACALPLRLADAHAPSFAAFAALLLLQLAMTFADALAWLRSIARFIGVVRGI